MVILANSDLRELGAVKDANLTVDLNGNRNFSLRSPGRIGSRR